MSKSNEDFFIIMRYLEYFNRFNFESCRQILRSQEVIREND
jgi:hypothetical protein